MLTQHEEGVNATSLHGERRRASDEQAQLRDALLRRLSGCTSSDAWSRLGEAGVLGICVPERDGGLGLGVVDAATVMEVLGELCLPTPYLETVIIAARVLAGAERPKRELLRAIAEQQAIVAVAGLEPSGIDDMTARRTAEGWRLDGTAKLVLDGAQAQAMLVVARDERGERSVFLIESLARSTSLRAFPTIDGRSAADVTFVDTPLPADALVGSAGVLDEVLDAAVAALAVEAAALMWRLVRDTVDYARQRVQFDQPIAQFQVVQHRLVDMHIEARRAGAAARRAIASIDGSPEALARAASAAKVTICRAGRFVGQNAVQLHGGMGMTEELPVGRYFKRLTVIEAQLGSADHHLRRFMRLRAA